MNLSVPNVSLIQGGAYSGMTLHRVNIKGFLALSISYVDLLESSLVHWIIFVLFDSPQ